VQARTTNSTVRCQCPDALYGSDVRDAATSLDQGIPALVSAFAARFESVFPIPPSNRTTEKFSQAITSNLLGGIGYFYGSSIEDRGFAYEWDEEDGETEGEKTKGPELTEPRELFTATPSRSFFPRGFYWCVC
jgi:mannosyl-oligosaccharide glucosidase